MTTPEQPQAPKPSNWTNPEAYANPPTPSATPELPPLTLDGFNKLLNSAADEYVAAMTAARDAYCGALSAAGKRARESSLPLAICMALYEVSFDGIERAAAAHMRSYP